MLGIKNCYSFHRIDLPNLSPIEVVAAEIEIENQTFVIASVYISPSSNLNPSVLRRLVTCTSSIYSRSF